MVWGFYEGSWCLHRSCSHLSMSLCKSQPFGSISPNEQLPFSNPNSLPCPQGGVLAVKGSSPSLRTRADVKTFSPPTREGNRLHFIVSCFHGCCCSENAMKRNINLLQPTSPKSSSALHSILLPFRPSQAGKLWG